MKVVILCGGRGERMRPLTDDRPKPLIEVGGRPILWHIMKHYARHGFRDFVLACGYKSRMIQDWFMLGGGVNALEMSGILWPDTGLDTQTGGRLLRCRDYIDGDTFLCTYGDGLSDVDLGKLLDFHRSHGKTATVTVVKQRLPWGILGVSSDGRVRDFVEKPLCDDWTSAGFFVFNRSVLDRIAGDRTRLESGTLPALAHDGELMAYRHTGFFKGMDTLADAAELNRMWQEGKALWRTWE